MGPLVHRFYSIVNTTVPHNPQLLESVDAEPQRTMDTDESQIWRNCGCGGRTIHGFQLHGGLVPLSRRVVQEPTILAKVC